MGRSENKCRIEGTLKILHAASHSRTCRQEDTQRSIFPTEERSRDKYEIVAGMNKAVYYYRYRQRLSYISSDICSRCRPKRSVE